MSQLKSSANTSGSTCPSSPCARRIVSRSRKAQERPFSSACGATRTAHNPAAAQIILDVVLGMSEELLNCRRPARSVQPVSGTAYPATSLTRSACRAVPVFSNRRRDMRPDRGLGHAERACDLRNAADLDDRQQYAKLGRRQFEGAADGLGAADTASVALRTNSAAAAV